MQWLLNELSLEQRFNSEAEFLASFIQFFEQAMPLIKQKRLFASRVLAEQVICAGKTFRQIIQQSNRRDIKSFVLLWLDKSGPFWTDEKQQHQDNYFEFDDIDVTDFAIGEATRRHIAGGSCTVLSIEKGVFDYSPLIVQHGLSEQILGQYKIDNDWDIKKVVTQIENALTLPVNWRGALQQLREKYHKTLMLPEWLLADIDHHAFSAEDYRALDNRLKVLNDFLLSRDNGKSTTKTQQILQQHFFCRRPWFSPEGEKAENKFSEQLTFLNPETNQRQQYSFHGKINNERRPKLRFYFDWPVPEQQQKIAIVYFGQKITKN